MPEEKVEEPGEELEAEPALAGEAAETPGQPQETAIDWEAQAKALRQEVARLRNDMRSQRIQGLNQAQRDARLEAIEQSMGVVISHLSGELDQDSLGPRVTALRQQAQKTAQAQQEAEAVAAQNEAYAEIIRLVSAAGLPTDPQKLAEAPEMKTVMSFWELATTHKVPAAFDKAVEAARLVAERKQLENATPRRKPQLDMSTGPTASGGGKFSGKVTQADLEDPEYWAKNKEAILEAQREGKLTIV